ncbi:CRISPR system precrRNA processing endoribonuclease RAMP protein Cas6 [Streptomyces canus]|uniref:CRISPR system precrRNA processing endoribonuclease RAMP protein Cas6 n=1 Tax=Streptomyces canus TaxID=58343 RepID=UPI0038697DF0|nr:CRISPR system precrRNA processing endoribonuclease RAMP protein Cas6 [Streptomyces canus]
MPARWTLTLTCQTPIRPATPAQLHGLACTLFEGTGADHTSHNKPFTVSPLLNGPDPHTAELCLGWLDDTNPPPPTLPTTHRIRLGSQFLTVHHADFEPAPYQDLLNAPPASRADIAFLSPTHFTDAGRSIPLPDPRLVYQSLLRRWNHHAPRPLPESSAAGLFDSLLLTAHDTATTAVTLGPGRRTGFTGTVTYALHHHADTPTRHAFTALTRFAAVAGIGAQTTHAQGYVRIHLHRPHRQTPAPPSGPRP